MRSPPTQAHDIHPRLRVSQAAQYCGCSESFLNKLRSRGGGPRYAKVLSIVTYRVEDLDLWLDSHRRFSASEDAA